MLNKKFIITILISVFLTLSLTACEDDDETEISQIGGQASHNTGQNCFSCHISGGAGESVFIAAGSVYTLQDLTIPLPNVKIEFHSGPNATGTLVHTIEVDAFGNFYTTETIAWDSGLYVSVINAGVTNSMSFSLTEGECGRCHGANETVIYG